MTEYGVGSGAVKSDSRERIMQVWRDTLGGALTRREKRKRLTKEEDEALRAGAGIRMKTVTKEGV